MRSRLRSLSPGSSASSDHFQSNSKWRVAVDSFSWPAFLLLLIRLARASCLLVCCRIVSHCCWPLRRRDFIPPVLLFLHSSPLGLSLLVLLLAMAPNDRFNQTGRPAGPRFDDPVAWAPLSRSGGIHFSTCDDHQTNWNATHTHTHTRHERSKLGASQTERKKMKRRRRRRVEGKKTNDGV